jgi:GH25 family lysozyme M1 (1,4-beta-N-acetylmuramidase)
MWRYYSNVWADTLEGQGRSVGLYGSKYFLLAIGFEAQWNCRPLWLASYPLDASFARGITATQPWTSWTIWQYGGGSAKPYGNETTWPGIDGYSDVNIANGSVDDLRAACVFNPYAGMSWSKT